MSKSVLLYSCPRRAKKHSLHWLVIKKRLLPPVVRMYKDFITRHFTHFLTEIARRIYALRINDLVARFVRQYLELHVPVLAGRSHKRYPVCTSVQVALGNCLLIKQSAYCIRKKRINHQCNEIFRLLKEHI